MLKRIAEQTVTTDHGDLTMYCYDDQVHQTVTYRAGQG